MRCLISLARPGIATFNLEPAGRDGESALGEVRTIRNQWSRVVRFLGAECSGPEEDAMKRRERSYYEFSQQDISSLAMTKTRDLRMLERAPRVNPSVVENRSTDYV